MALADLTKETPRPGHKKCYACHVATLLTKKDRADLETALTLPHVTATQIATELHNLGHTYLKEGTIARHRRGRCDNGIDYLEGTA